MNQARVGLLVAAALTLASAAAIAQPKPPTKPAAPAAPAKPAAPGAPAAPGKGAPAAPAKGGEINLDEPGTPAPAPAAAEAPAGEGLGDICKIDPSACPTINMDQAAARELKPPVYAVQQIYALRNHRFELNPFFGITMNDQFVSHPSFGLAANYWLTNVIAVGVSGNFYQNSNSAFNFETSRAGRVSEPITEYQWNANANMEYVPAYGKFAGFSDFIFHYDVFLIGGVGAISTRPIPVVDPDNRSFDWQPKVSFHLGGGLRIFVNRWLAATLEVSDYIFADQLENPTIAEGTDANGTPNAQNKSTWVASGSSLTNNVQAQVGVSVFLPFTWEYRLPK